MNESGVIGGLTTLATPPDMDNIKGELFRGDLHDKLLIIFSNLTHKFILFIPFSDLIHLLNVLLGAVL